MQEYARITESNKIRPTVEFEMGGSEMRWLLENYPMLQCVRLRLVADTDFEGGEFHLPAFEGDSIEIRLAAGDANRFARLKQSRQGGGARYSSTSGHSI